jgi:4-hydroxy-2-oxoheptanedioate aldolase
VVTNHQESVRAGAWSTLSGSFTAEILARSGVAWVALDAQHGTYDQADIQDTLLALHSVPVPIFVRVADDSAAGIGRVLDCGAAGVIVPLVDGPDQAAAAARACRYPPRGARSWGPVTGLVGRIAPDPRPANDHVMCAVMIETRAGIDSVRQIAATEGVDMVFVGPFDLSLALGLDVDDLLADDSDGSPLTAVLQACAESGIRAGAFAGSPARADRLAALGFTDVVVLTDASLWATAAAAEAARWSAPDASSDGFRRDRACSLSAAPPPRRPSQA